MQPRGCSVTAGVYLSILLAFASTGAVWSRDPIPLPGPPAKIEMLSPVNTVARETQLGFLWGAVGAPDQIEYRVRVYDFDPAPSDVRAAGPPLWEKAVSGGLPTAVYAGPRLAAGKQYLWTVEAFGPSRNLVARGAALFLGPGSDLSSWSPCALFLFDVIPARICQETSFTLSPFLFTFQPGGTTYTLTANNGPAGSGPWPGGITLTPTTTTEYVLTLQRGTCQESTSFTVQVAPKPALGAATGSAAFHQSDPPKWLSEVPLCCGRGLKLKVDPPVVGVVQWQSSPDSPSPQWTDLAGATGTTANLNPGSALLACKAQPTTTLFRAVAMGDPVCPTAVANTVKATVYPPSQAGTLSVSKPVLCKDGVSTSTVSLGGPLQGTLTWLKQPGCKGGFSPFNPANPLSFSVGPLQQKECYKAVVQSGSCAPVEQVVQVDVEDKPVPGTITPKPDKICPGQDSELTLTGQRGNVQWLFSPGCNTFSDMPGATGNTMQNTNILQQTTCYRVRVSSPLGACPPVLGPAAQVSVDALPSPPAISGPAALCAGGKATLQVAPPVSSGTYQWFRNGLPAGSGTSVTVNQPGNYWVTLTSRCGSADSQIFQLKSDLLTVAITGPCCACNGQKVKVCGTAANGAPQYSYQWNGGATLQCISVAPTATTTYTVTASDANGCKASSSFTVTVCQ